MRTQDLEYFIHLTKTQSFTATAEALGISQPAVSLMIKRLEDELDTTLFIRKRGNNILKLTETGKIFQKQAEKILQLVESTKKEINDKENNSIQLGVPPIIGATLLPLFLPNLIKFSEKIQIIEKGGSKAILNLLRKGEINTALVGFSQPIEEEAYPDITTTLLIKDQFQIWVGENHPLAKKTTVSLKDLREQSFVTLGENYVQHQVFLNWANTHNIDQTNIFSTNEVATAKSFVKANVGATMLIEMATNTNEGLVKLNLGNISLPYFYIYLMVRTSSKEDSLQNIVSNEIKEVARKHFSHKSFH